MDEELVAIAQKQGKLYINATRIVSGTLLEMMADMPRCTPAEFADRWAAAILARLGSNSPPILLATEDELK